MHKCVKLAALVYSCVKDKGTSGGIIILDLKLYLVVVLLLDELYNEKCSFLLIKSENIIDEFCEHIENRGLF